MEKLEDPREIGERFARSLRSDLKAFIVDKNLVDQKVIERIIMISGIDSVVRRTVVGGEVLVYYISPRLVRRRCQQDECRDVPPEHKRACIDRCYRRLIDTLAEEAAKSILEALDSMEL